MTSVDLGDFTQWEIPDPLTYTFENASGAPITLTGLAGSFVMRHIGDSAVQRSATIAPDQAADTGQITVTWEPGDFAEPGLYVGEFIAYDATTEHRSVPIVWRVRPATDVQSDVDLGMCSLWADADDVDQCAGGVPLSDVQLVERLLAVASRVCYLLGGSRWPGVCEQTVVVARETCGHWWRHDGRILRVDDTPIVEITEIRLDGVVADPSTYTVVDDDKILRLGDERWPTPGRLHDSPPRIEVTYTWGGQPPELGRRAAAVLARELMLAACGDSSCRLDRRVTSLIREGVSLDLAAAIPGLIDALAQGRTGLPEVDLFVFAENPAGLRRPARFVVADGRPTIHRLR